MGNGLVTIREPGKACHVNIDSRLSRLSSDCKDIHLPHSRTSIYFIVNMINSLVTLRYGKPFPENISIHSLADCLMMIR